MTNRDGDTVLHLAAEQDEEDLAALLCAHEAGPDLMASGDFFGRTPLHRAAMAYDVFFVFLFFKFFFFTGSGAL